MKLFRISAGSPSFVMTKSQWDAGEMTGSRNWVTKKENVFELEELVCDPINPDRITQDAWSMYARTGWYAFMHRNPKGTGTLVLMVHGKHVEIL